MSKNALLKGTLILTLAALVTRVLGVAQRIPLQRILGDEGMATYGIAYNIYGILLIIATVGIPSALSKQIAEYHALGLYHEARQTYRASRDFSLVAGLVATVVLYLVAPYYAVHISHDPDAALSIRAIAPALLLFPLISIMRGYFQGLQFMSPTGLSQVSEQILRVGVAVLFPVLLLSAGWSKEVAVAGASFGAVAGSVGAILVLLYFFRKERGERKRELEKQREFRRLPRKEIFRGLLKTAIPISLASTAIPLIYFIDSSTVIPLLQGALGQAGAKEMLGILTGRAQSLASIPPILAIALSSAVLPAVASSFSKGELGEVTRTGSLALRLTLVTGAPLALYLTAGAFAVNGFLFGDVQGSWVVALLCFGSIFQMVMMTSMAILQGLGKVMLPMWFVFAGIVAKAILNPVLTPLFGIYGVIVATSAAFVVILFLNMWAIRREVPLNVIGDRLGGFMVASAGLVAVVWLVYQGCVAVLPGGWHPAIYYGLICMVTGLVSFPVYGLLLVWRKGLAPEDIRYLPGPVRKICARMGIGG